MTLERWYAARVNSHVVEVKGASHPVYVSRTKKVAALIEKLHRTLSKKRTCNRQEVKEQQF